MNIVIVDESKKRTVQITEAMQKNKNAVTCCRSTNEFMTRISSGALPGRIFMDVASWNNGKAITSCFDVGKKLAEVPIVFYNAHQEFSGIKDRPKHGQDQILLDPTPVETVVDLIKSLL